MILAIILSLILLSMLLVIVTLFTLLVKEQEKVHDLYIKCSQLMAKEELL